MAITRLERKGRKNKNVAKKRTSDIKRLQATPIIKNNDIEAIKKQFESKSVKSKKPAAKSEEAKSEVAEAKVEKQEPATASEEKPKVKKAPKEESKTEKVEEVVEAKVKDSKKKASK